MDRFSVKGEELRNFYSPDTALERVFRDIERDLSANQLVVCQFIVNGMALTEADEFKFAKVKLVEVEQLEYLVDQSTSLIYGVLAGWIDSLPELIKAAESLAKKVRKGAPFSDRQFHKNHYELIENCEYLASSVKSIRSLLGDQVAAITLNWDQNIDQIQEACKKSLEQFEKKNQGELASVIEYDLSHSLQCLLDDLNQLEMFFNGERQARHTSSRRSREDSLVDRKKFFN